MGHTAGERQYQQDFFLFQAGQSQSEPSYSDTKQTLLKRYATHIYQQVSKLDAKTSQPKQPTAQFDERSNAKPTLKAEIPVPKPVMAETDRFGLSTPEQAKALLVLAHFDRQLNRMVEEQQALSKADVKNAYRRILKQYHPDQSHFPITGEVIKKVQVAYEKLRTLL